MHRLDLQAGPPGVLNLTVIESIIILSHHLLCSRTDTIIAWYSVAAFLEILFRRG